MMRTLKLARCSSGKPASPSRAFLRFGVPSFMVARHCFATREHRGDHHGIRKARAHEGRQRRHEEGQQGKADEGQALLTSNTTEFLQGARQSRASLLSVPAAARAPSFAEPVATSVVPHRPGPCRVTARRRVRARWSTLTMWESFGSSEDAPPYRTLRKKGLACALAAGASVR